MTNIVRTVLALACLSGLAIAGTSFSSVPAQAQTLGEQANQAADEVTQALKQQLLEARLVNFSAADEWTTTLLNKHLTSDHNFRRFLSDDDFAKETLEKMEHAKYYLQLSTAPIQENGYGHIMQMLNIYFPNTFPIHPNLAS